MNPFFVACGSTFINIIDGSFKLDELIARFLEILEYILWEWLDLNLRFREKPMFLLYLS